MGTGIRSKFFLIHLHCTVFSGHSVYKEELPSGSSGPVGLRQWGSPPGSLQHLEESVLESWHQQQEGSPRHWLCVSTDDLCLAGHQGTNPTPQYIINCLVWESIPFKIPLSVSGLCLTKAWFWVVPMDVVLGINLFTYQPKCLVDSKFYQPLIYFCFYQPLNCNCIFHFFRYFMFLFVNKTVVQIRSILKQKINFKAEKSHFDFRLKGVFLAYWHQLVVLHPQ